MVLDGMRRDSQLGGNFLVDQPLRDEAQYFQLTRRQRGTLLGHRRLPPARGGDESLIYHEIRHLGIADDGHVRIGAQQRHQPPPHDGIRYVEMNPQLHVTVATRASTSGAGTASASPPTIIAATPITRPAASARGPPELPGANRTSACTHAYVPRPLTAKPRGSRPTACKTPALIASCTPKGWPTANTSAPGRSRAGSPVGAPGTSRPPARTTARSRRASRATTDPRARRPSAAITVTSRCVATWALVTIKPDAPQAIPAPPLPRSGPSTIATTLGMSRAAAPLTKEAIIAATAAVRRSGPRSSRSFRRAPARASGSSRRHPRRGGRAVDRGCRAGLRQSSRSRLRPAGRRAPPGRRVRSTAAGGRRRAAAGCGWPRRIAPAAWRRRSTRGTRTRAAAAVRPRGSPSRREWWWSGDGSARRN